MDHGPRVFATFILNPTAHKELPLNEAVVVAEGLVKMFGSYRAVDNVSLTIPQGSIFGVLGPNGAGKTTTLRMLLGIIDPDSGTRTLLGHARPRSVAHRVGYLPEERGLYPSMTARDSIAFMGALRGLPLAEGRRRADERLAALGLGHAPGLKIRKLSKGMAQMVQLVGALIHDPELIVLDEPFSGLDPVNQERLEKLVLTESITCSSTACQRARRSLISALRFRKRWPTRSPRR